MIGHRNDQIQIPFLHPGGPILPLEIVSHLGVGEDRCREDCLGVYGLYRLMDILHQLGDIPALLLRPKGIVIVLPAHVQGEFFFDKPFGHRVLYPDREKPRIRPPALHKGLHGFFIESPARTGIADKIQMYAIHVI